MSKQYAGQLYINGGWCDASDGRTFEVLNPFDESVVGTAADATVEDVSAAVGAARNASDTTTWSTDVRFRRHCLTQLEQGLMKVKAQLADMATQEAGIPSNQANLMD